MYQPSSKLALFTKMYRFILQNLHSCIGWGNKLLYVHQMYSWSLPLTHKHLLRGIKLQISILVSYFWFHYFFSFYDFYSRLTRVSIWSRTGKWSKRLPMDCASLSYTAQNNWFLDAFKKLRKTIISSAMSVRLFLRPCGTTWLPLDKFSRNFIFKWFF